MTKKAAAPATLEPHALTALTPEMPVDQVDALAQDIKKNGLKQPIVLFEGKILDGRARVKACAKAGVAVETVTLPVGQAPRAFVYSMNIHRRQLTGVQLARVACGYMQESKGKLTQEEVADLFGLGAKTLRYTMRALTSGNEGLIKLVENPDTTRGELRAALTAAGIMPDKIEADDIGSNVAVEPAPHKAAPTTQAGSKDVDDLLGTSGDKATTGGTLPRATLPQASTVGKGAAAAAAASHRPSAAAVTHVGTMAALVDTLARSTAQDLDAFYKAAVQRGVWARLQAVHAKAAASAATAKADKSSRKATAKA